MKTTLLAVTGLSPAIITETLWALAELKPAILPDRVGFITTVTGAEMIEKHLFTPRPDWKGLSVWDALRKSVKAGHDQLIADPINIITIPEARTGRARFLDDIRTPEENSAAAEFIFSRVWDVVRDKDRRLIASVAGGRKTMGALLHAAVSLIGRKEDFLTHILVDPPYDTLPGFFFPSQPGGAILDRNGTPHSPKSANPLLAEVPFVSLRNRFKDLDDLPGSFLVLRDTIDNRLAKDAEREVPIRIEHDRRRFLLDGVPYRTKARTLAVLEFILRCHLKGQTFDMGPKAPQDLAAEAFVKWHERNAVRLTGVSLGDGFTARNLTRDLSDLRTLLKDAAWHPAERTFIQAPFRLDT
jgi:CRISPR-associated protein (TIGR02584 family)